MLEPEYNDEEKKLIEQIHNSFKKDELNPNIAIGQVGLSEGKYNYYSFESEQFEAFFRGISWPKFMGLMEHDNSFFFPAKLTPIPWWELEIKEIDRKFQFSESVRMTPYGKYYYLPYFLLAFLHDLNLTRLNKGSADHIFPDELWRELLPYKTIRKDCWSKIESLPLEYKDPFNKEILFEMGDEENFIAFLSFFDVSEKKAVSEFVRYGSSISFKEIFDERYYFMEGENLIKVLLDCWDF